jgi:hypothetical protein
MSATPAPSPFPFRFRFAPGQNRSLALFLAILPAVIVTPNAFASPKPRLPLTRQPHSLLARVTVYWASGGRGSDRYTRQHKCATGMRLRDGYCAVDPKQIPYGSHIIFPDGTSLAAVDTGTAVRNRKAARLLGRTPLERSAVVIDRFFEKKQQALAWASTHPHFITVRIVSPTPRGVLIPHGNEPIRRAISVSSKVAIATNANKSSAALRLPKVH